MVYLHAQTASDIVARSSYPQLHDELVAQYVRH